MAGSLDCLSLNPAGPPASVSAPDEPQRPSSNAVSAKAAQTETQSGVSRREDQRVEGFYFWAERQVLGGSRHSVPGRTEGRRAVWRPQLCFSSSQMRRPGMGTAGLGAGCRQSLFWGGGRHGDKMTASIYPSIYSLYMLEMTLVGRCACANLLGDTRVLLWLA